MLIELIFVGTELLLGDILNTNARHISKLLASVGASVHYQTVVGDNEKRLEQTIRLALSRADMVITTGGLGPTPDDLTKEVCAKVMEKELVLHEPSLEKIKRFFASKNIEMAKNNEKRAMLPIEDGKNFILKNDAGTAPGCVMEKDGKIVAVLPGPPREMRPMLRDVVERFIAPKTNCVIRSHSVRTFGIGESSMSELVSDIFESENPTVAPYAKDGEALLRVTAMGKDADDCESLMSPILSEIEKRLGEYIYGIDVENLERATVELLKKYNLTVSTAESCTGGLVAKRITDVSGSSSVFHCGIVSYSNEIKNRVLGVDKTLLETEGAVCAETARRMADGVRKISGSDISVSVTGIAGPLSDDSNKPVGLVYVGISSKLGTRAIEIKTGHRGPGCRDYNRTISALNCLNEVRKEILLMQES